MGSHSFNWRLVANQPALANPHSFGLGAAVSSVMGVAHPYPVATVQPISSPVRGVLTPGGGVQGTQPLPITAGVTATPGPTPGGAGGQVPSEGAANAPGPASISNASTTRSGGGVVYAPPNNGPTAAQLGQAGANILSMLGVGYPSLPPTTGPLPGGTTAPATYQAPVTTQPVNVAPRFATPTNISPVTTVGRVVSSQSPTNLNGVARVTTQPVQAPIGILDILANLF